MENTLENKAKFFAQYWWQDVFMLNGNKYKTTRSRFTRETLVQKCYLELNPLHLITDEDAIELAKIFSFISDGKGLIVLRYDKYISINDQYNDNQDIADCLRIYFEDFDVFSLDENENILSPDWYRFIEATDFLRSKGYALPYNGLSVSEQVERGWVKLIS